jgi:hypothetical protein
MMGTAIPVIFIHLDRVSEAASFLQHEIIGESIEALHGAA